jgi:hypothetical protein
MPFITENNDVTLDPILMRIMYLDWMLFLIDISRRSMFYDHQYLFKLKVMIELGFGN